MDNNEATSSRGNEALESRSDAGSKNPNGLDDASLNNSVSQTPKHSAVDKVIKTLWGGTSSFEDTVDKPAVDSDYTGRSKEPEGHLQPPNMVTPTDSKRDEDSSLNSRAPHESGSRQTDSFHVQSPSQERQVNDKEQDRQGRYEPSR